MEKSKTLEGLLRLGTSIRNSCLSALVAGGLALGLNGCDNPIPTNPEQLEEICNQPIPEGYVNVSGTWIEKDANGFGGTMYILKQCGTEVTGTTSYHKDIIGWVKDKTILEFYIDDPFDEENGSWIEEYVESPTYGANDSFSGRVNENYFQGTQVSKFDGYVFNIDLVRWSSATEKPEEKDANGNMLAPWVEMNSDTISGGQRTITWTIHNTKAGQNYLQWLSFDSGQNPCDGCYNAGGYADPGVFTATEGDGIALRIEDNDSNNYNDTYSNYESATQTYITTYTKGQAGIRIFDNQGYSDCDSL